jgi:hypothetical protein
MRILYSSRNENPGALINALNAENIKVVLAPGTSFNLPPQPSTPSATLILQDINTFDVDIARPTVAIEIDDMKQILFEILKRVRTLS